MTEHASVLIEAWQETLAGEHAAIYAYEVIGGRLKAGSRPQRRATTAYRHHRGRRDSLTARIRDAGATPVTAEPAYSLPVEVTNPASAAELAVRVEQRCTNLYAEVVATASGRERRAALEAMTWCATHIVDWGGSSSALPGVVRR